MCSVLMILAAGGLGHDPQRRKGWRKQTEVKNPVIREPKKFRLCLVSALLAFHVCVVDVRSLSFRLVPVPPFR
jgi:hypothetical protein